MTQSGGRLWARHPHVRSGGQLTFGERAADVMRNAFGSWAFVGSFLLFMALWMVLNTVILHKRAFDAFPYILLNLSLSMMAGLQGALILIAAKRADRIAAEQATAHYAETSRLDDLLAQNTTLTEAVKRDTALLNALTDQLQQNTDLTQAVHDLAGQIHVIVAAVPARPVTPPAEILECLDAVRDQVASVAGLLHARATVTAAGEAARKRNAAAEVATAAEAASQESGKSPLPRRRRSTPAAAEPGDSP